MQVLKACGDLSVDDIKKRILAELENYTCADDVTMVILRRTGQII
jgi:hypothetical protein